MSENYNVENEDINNDNFILYLMSNYRDRQCTSIDDFYNDLKIFKYLKRLILRYANKKDLNLRLIINHIIILYNLFGDVATTKILFFKFEEQYHSILKTLLVFLKKDVAINININGKDLDLMSINLNDELIIKLREFKE